jgi:hypothetical protein
VSTHAKLAVSKLPATKAKLPLVLPRKKGVDEEERERGGKQPQPPPMGGPLGLHAAPVKIDAPPISVAALCDRMVVGKTREGLPEVRLDVSAGLFHGTEVRLVAGVKGIEATFVTATESARRVIEAQLADLARGLEGRGVRVVRCQVTARPKHQKQQEDPTT